MNNTEHGLATNISDDVGEPVCFFSLEANMEDVEGMLIPVCHCTDDGIEREFDQLSELEKIDLLGDWIAWLSHAQEVAYRRYYSNPVDGAPIDEWID